MYRLLLVAVLVLVSMALDEEASCGCSSGTQRGLFGEDEGRGLKQEEILMDEASLKETSLEEEECSTGYKMVPIPGGTFVMGTDTPSIESDGEGPARKVTVSPFEIMQFEVSNQDFLRFVQANPGFVSDAEKYKWSFVFEHVLSAEELAKIDQQVKSVPWWLPVEGADWRHPEGRDSSIETRMDHPVVHVSHNDAKLFCEWAQMRLPTEAEFERVMKGMCVFCIGWFGL